MIRYGYVNQDHVFAFLNGCLKDGDLLMMDNAGTDNRPFKELEEYGITIVRQPAYSPDVQPVESVFSILSRMVYRDNVWFHNKQDLELSVMSAA
jgi:transposase